MNKIILLILVVASLASCTLKGEPEPSPIVEPPFLRVFEKDSLVSGEFLGIKIGDSAEDVYKSVQNQPKANNLQIVANVVKEFSNIKERILLYDYMLFDEIRGTENGVQLTFTNGLLTGFYLNSGKAIKAWPSGESKNTSFRLGDRIEDIGDKLVAIKSKAKYKKYFERTMLLTKDLKKGYDNEMSHSPYWYFAYSDKVDHLNMVKLHLKDGKLEYIIVEYLK